MKLGFNFMWAYNRYGTYFGPHRANPILPPEPLFDPDDPPENWDVARIRDPRLMVKDEEVLSDKDRWVEAFPGHMRYLKNSLKIDVVRIFLLCNAINYGTLDKSGIYQPPAYLHPRFRWHFKKILEGAEQAGVQLIPSLIDFGIGHPDNKSVMRWPIIHDPNFFWMAFEPLLQISKKYKSTIYAWEVMNEPSWLNAEYWPHRLSLWSPVTWQPRKPWVTEAAVSSFLQKGIDKIESHGFASTVGHRYFADLKKYPTGSIPQFHYYPSNINPANEDPDAVPDALATGLPTPPILGEFGSKATDQGDPWPELKGVDYGNTPDRVFERLKLLQRKNYSLAMIWPDGPDPTDQLSDPLKFTSDCELGITRYLDYFNLR